MNAADRLTTQLATLTAVDTNNLCQYAEHRATWSLAYDLKHLATVAA